MRGMLLCLISPAKSLELEKPFPIIKTTQPAFSEQKRLLAQILSRLDLAEVKVLLSVSDKLAALNWSRFQSLTQRPERPAIFTYSGDVYTVLDAFSLSKSALNILPDRLLIISALYGLLKPYDMINPYRLEMDAPLDQFSDITSLTSFWSSSLTKYIQKRAKDLRFIVNLASDQYANAIDWSQCPCPVVKPVFYDYKNGRYKSVSFSMKRARGAFLRYLLEENIQDLSGLYAFKERGYIFQPNISTPDKLVFYCRHLDT